MRLYSAACVFRIAVGPGQDLFSAVKAVKDSLKRTRQRLALLVHPDKASNNELSRYKTVFDEAFKVLTAAHDTLIEAVEGRYDAGGGTAGAAGGGGGSKAGSTSQQQPRQQQPQAQARRAGRNPYDNMTGFNGGQPPWGFAGFNPNFYYYWTAQ